MKEKLYRAQIQANISGLFCKPQFKLILPYWRKCQRSFLKATHVFNFSLRHGTLIKFLPLDVSHRIPWMNKNAVYHLQISALVPEILKFEKMCKICKWDYWRRHNSTEITPTPIKNSVSMKTHSFPGPTRSISICYWFLVQNTLNEAKNWS